MNIKTLVLILSLFLTAPAYGVDIVSFGMGISDKDLGKRFKQTVLEEALEHTKDEYGDYKIYISNKQINIKRAKNALSSGGQQINTYVAITTKEWEEKAIPIRIPLRRGLISYRLPIVKKSNTHLFENIESSEDLKKLKVGLIRGLTTNKIMKEHGFKVEESTKTENLFVMLDKERFHYTIRGVHEAFDLVEAKNASDLGHDELVVAPNVAIYIPTPTYLFVAKEDPELAERLERGLRMMTKDGTLERLFNEFFADDLEQAKLKSRKIIRIDDPWLPEATPLDDKSLWYVEGKHDLVN